MCIYYDNPDLFTHISSKILTRQRVQSNSNVRGLYLEFEIEKLRCPCSKFDWKMSSEMRKYNFKTDKKRNSSHFARILAANWDKIVQIDTVKTRFLLLKTSFRLSTISFRNFVIYLFAKKPRGLEGFILDGYWLLTLLQQAVLTFTLQKIFWPSKSYYLINSSVLHSFQNVLTDSQ